MARDARASRSPSKPRNTNGSAHVDNGRGAPLVAVTSAPLMPLTPEQHFANWESHVFGYGYGSGEEHVLPALKAFLVAIGNEADRPNSYDYRVLEQAVGPVPAWLLLNAMCHADVFEYGTSPRFGWLTRKGEKLRDFIAGKTADELVAICTESENQTHCAPDVCNCGPNGWEPDKKCDNPFF